MHNINLKRLFFLVCLCVYVPTCTRMHNLGEDANDVRKHICLFVCLLESERALG